MVEDIFALAVTLQIGRRGRRDRAVLALDDDRRRLPTSALADAARILQRAQKSMGQERIVRPGKRIPLRRVERGDAGRDTRNHPIFTVGHRPPK